MPTYRLTLYLSLMEEKAVTVEAASEEAAIEMADDVAVGEWELVDIHYAEVDGIEAVQI